MSPLSRPLFVPLAVLASLAAQAQAPPSVQNGPSGTGSIAGIVSDSSGVGIVGANVSVAGVAGQAISSSEGAFRLSGIASGTHRMVTRRIGFHPETLAVSVPTDGTLDLFVQLAPAAHQIAPVVIAASRRRYTGRLRGFNERRERGHGHFFTAEDIERRAPRSVTDLLRTVPGARIAYQTGQNVITFRGLRCTPLIWIDGAPASAGYLDPDVLAVTTLAGIEVYPGPATVPSELMWVRGKGSCGVIALWTKMPEPRAKRANQVSAQTLAEMVESLRLYTADNVDTPVAPDSAHPVSPSYPDSLFRAAVSGRVVVEFVVDINGTPDMATFGAVLSTHAPFTEAVRAAVSSARFTPAWLGGRRVRQLLQLPFAFKPPGNPVPKPGSK